MDAGSCWQAGGCAGVDVDWKCVATGRDPSGLVATERGNYKQKHNVH